MEYKKRVTEDVVEIDGRTFVLKKYDPMLGNYILMAAASSTLPFGISEALGKAFGVRNESSGRMNKEDFMQLQRDVLSSCYERLPAGDAPIINQGGYGVENIDTKILINLFLSSMIFNFSDFFDEEPSKSSTETKTTMGSTN